MEITTFFPFFEGYINQPKHPDRDTVAWGDQPEGLPMN